MPGRRDLPGPGSSISSCSGPSSWRPSWSACSAGSRPAVPRRPPGRGAAGPRLDRPGSVADDADGRCAGDRPGDGRCGRRRRAPVAAGGVGLARRGHPGRRARHLDPADRARRGRHRRPGGDRRGRQGEPVLGLRGRPQRGPDGAAAVSAATCSPTDGCVSSSAIGRPRSRVSTRAGSRSCRGAWPSGRA